MKDKPFDNPVIISLDAESDRDVTSLKEALAILGDEWPVGRRGPMHAEAMRACHDSLGALYPVAKARDAFSAAAWEADVFVSDLPRLGETAPQEGDQALRKRRAA